MYGPVLVLNEKSFCGGREQDAVMYPASWWENNASQALMRVLRLCAILTFFPNTWTCIARHDPRRPRVMSSVRSMFTSSQTDY